MFKKRVIIFLLVIVSFLFFFSTGSADIIPVKPELTLRVDQSPLCIYPPIMIYTAQLNYIPNPTYSRLYADFYNINAINEDSTGACMVFLGRAPFDNTGKAVLSKQMRRGKYVAIAKTRINNNVIVSNKVRYIVH